MFDAIAGRFQCGTQQFTSGEVAAALLGDMIVVVQSGGHGRLDRCGEHLTGVLAHFEQGRDHSGVTGDESGAITGHV